MKNFIIITDVNSDLNSDLRARFEIEYLHAHITVPKMGDLPGTLEWDFTDPKTFYTELTGKVNEYKTAPASPDEYKEAFTKYLSKGYDILSLSISKALSGTYEFACMGRDLALKDFPERKIICLDAKKFSNGFGLIAILASLYREQGHTLEETAKMVEEYSPKVHQMGWLDDLSFVATKGRISHAKAFFGQLVGVKPLADFNKDGMATVLGKAKGKKNAYDAILKYIEATIENPSEQIILIAETNRHDAAMILKDKIQEKFHPKEILVNTVYPSCGINIGPGLMAAYYVGTPISSDFSQEQKIMNDILEKQ